MKLVNRGILFLMILVFGNAFAEVKQSNESNRVDQLTIDVLKREDEKLNEFSKITIPDDLQVFVEPKTKPIFYKAFDLDKKGNQAVLLILEKQPQIPNSEPIRDEQRILMILHRNLEGNWYVAVSNNNVVMCSLCGGMFGDPFQIDELEVKVGAFTLNFEGGGWHTAWAFQYDAQRNDWFLAQFDDASANRYEATTVISNKTYPKDFSYISLKVFNPSSFIGSLNVK